MAALSYENEMELDKDKLYPLRDALLYLGLRPTKFYAELKAKRIGAVKNGSRTNVTGSEIIRYRTTLKTIGRPLDGE